MKNIKGALWDYGGTIDSRGVHWSDVIYRAYSQAGLNIDRDIFRQAYVYGERSLGHEVTVEPTDTFLDLMRKKITRQLQWLDQQGFVKFDAGVSDRIAHLCYTAARECAEESRPWLEKLHSVMPMVMVSNFYGNLGAVISDMGIDHCFDAVIESARVGVSKPDPHIYALGLEALGIEAHDTVVVGDSFSKDIEPAMSLGCQTVWLKGTQWESTPSAAMQQYSGPIATNVKETVDTILG